MKYPYILTVIFAAAVVTSCLLGYIPWLMALIFLVISGLTFWVYAADKRAAQAGSWRVPEKRLQLLSLCGGWPGAVIAQETLRHKTRKMDFRIIFWFTVLLNISGFAWLHSTQGQGYLRHGVALLENALTDHVASPETMVAVLLLTRYPGRKNTGL